MKAFERLRDQLEELIQEIADTTVHGPTRRLPTLVTRREGWVWASDADGVYTWCSPEIRYVLGISAEEVVGRAVYEIGFVGSSTSRLQERFEAGQDIQNVRFEAQNEGGDRISLMLNAHAQLDEGGHCSGYLGATLLLGVEKLRPERMAVRLPLQAEQIGVSTPPPIAPTWGETHGFVDDEAGLRPIPHPLSKITEESHRSSVRLQVPIRIQDHVLGVLDFETGEEGPGWKESDRALVEAVAEDLALALQDARTFQLSQQALAEMREADRLKTQFLANMSHELRTPLNSIIGFSRVILKGIDGPINQTQKEDLEAIYNAGQHLLGLINDILDVSKIEAGRMELTFTEVDLREIIRGVMSTAVGLVKDKPIELVSDIPEHLPSVQADKMRLRQILLNLVSNAAKFTNEGQIGVSANVIDQGDREEVVVAVFDTGPGITPEDQEKLFEPFSQVDASSTRRTGGTGLGLSICRHLVELHGGRIWVESELDEGSTFAFTIPVFPRQMVTAPSSSTILFVEDKAEDLDQMRAHIEGTGLRFHGTLWPEDPLEAAKSFQPEAAFIDLELPDQSCWSILSRLTEHERTQSIPAGLFASDLETQRACLLFPHRHLTVPVDTDVLQLLLPILLTNHEKGGSLDVLFIADEDQQIDPLIASFKALGCRVDRAVHSALAALDTARADPPDLIVIDLTMHHIEGFFTLDGLRQDADTNSIPLLTISPLNPNRDEGMELRKGSSYLMDETGMDQDGFFSSLENTLDDLGLPPSD